MATPLENLNAALASASQNLAELEAAGPQAWVDYSVDGESYQYSQAKTALAQRIDSLQTTIQRMSGPFMKRSRGAV